MTATPTSTPTSAPTIGVTPVEATEMDLGPAGDVRTVRLFVPELAAGGKASLLILLHGFGELPSTMELRVQAGVVAARDKMLIAIPPGRNRNWDAVLQPGSTAESPDVAFVSELIDRLLEEYPIDPDRVFVGGFSMGAVLTNRIGCQLADRVRAVVIVGGSPWGGDCKPARPVSVLLVHGVTDTTMAIEDAKVLSDQWRTIDECPAESTQTAVGANAVALTSEGCDGGSRVEFVTVEGQGHVWFKTPDTTQLALDFLASAGP